MMLTLGQAAKEVGKSKTAISNAIKNGRLTAQRNDLGHYEIDPAALFNVYPPKRSSKSVKLTKLDPPEKPVNGGNVDGLTLQLTGLERVLEEKDKQIKLLEQSKTELREDLEDMKEQSKRITLLLENKSSGAGEWEKSLKTLEVRIANQEERLQQERAARERIEKEAQEKETRIRKRAAREIQNLKQSLDAEKSKSFWKKLFG